MKTRERTAKLVLNEHEYDAVSAAADQIRDIIENGPDDCEYYENLADGLRKLLNRSKWLPTGSPLSTKEES